MLSPRKVDGQIELANEDDSRSFPLSDPVWKVLTSPEILLDDFKRVLQSYCLATNRDWALILKEECPGDEAYRSLRSRLRTWQPA